jgi:hypothetical protein
MERGIRYPLGKDFFEIDHGNDYFSFFDRMGKSATYIATQGEELAAVGAIILRNVPSRADEAPKPCWYICDLKVAKRYRRRHIPIKMFAHGFPRKYPLCPRGYAVSMNPGDGSPNPVVRLAAHIRLAPVSVGGTLLLYSLSAEEMRIASPLIQFHRGDFGYLSMAGIKNIVLESTGAPMPIQHLQFGPCAQVEHKQPREGHTHMFCTPATDPLAEALLSTGHAAVATATVLHHRMADWTWEFILTNEI